MQCRVGIIFFILCTLLASSQAIPRPKKRDSQSCPAAERAAKMATKDLPTASHFVQKEIKSHKVVVFSKSYCPYCRKAKAALFSLLPENAVEVIELDQRPDGDAIQDALLELTGRRSVPQVFIDGEFFGGGDDTAAAAQNGSLEKLLKAKGIL